MSEDDRDPRLSLLTRLDIHTCRVEFSDTPIVLLCGGKVEIKSRPEDPDPPVRSLRHAIAKSHPNFEVFCPEEITSWQSDGVFKNLISFELELASICSLVVIILESEGALVELGAFSQLPELSKKIVAVCPDKYRDAISFINLGILRFISAVQPENVKSYPWEPERPNLISTEIVEDLSIDILEELKKIPKSQVFKVSQNSHAIVLICEFLKIFIALKETEILEYLKSCGIAVTNDELKGKLFLLEKFQLIRTKSYSDSIFYLRGKAIYHRIRMTAKDPSAPIDALREEVHCLEHYAGNKKHRNRHRAITAAGLGGKR
jgi:hypothetical protein